MHCRILFLLLAAFLLSSCATKDRIHTVKVSVRDQKMAVFRKGTLLATYDVSTSKYGLGDERGSRCTPLGSFEVAKKVGGGQPLGMKFKTRRPTGEIVKVNAPGRDPIVTRIFWLKGLESQNRRTYGRCIYIHGTPEEWRIGTPASYGCVRMRSRDVAALYGTIGTGARVEIVRGSLDLPAPAAPAQIAESKPAESKPAAKPKL